MKHAASCVAAVCLLLAWSPPPADAQGIPGFDWVWGNKQETSTETNHYVVTGAAELWQGDTRFSADKVDYYSDTHKLFAVGHVQLTQIDSVISADRMEFNTETQTGIFYNAWGMASLADRGDKVLFGGLEPDMYFEGQTIEKIGPKVYKITKGRFTTCVQPVPRWEITSGSVVISLEHYAVLKNPVIRVKNVPVLYVPIIYYPIKKEDRATGFLLPSFGTSTVRGFTLSNAFFWAIDRSQDLTLLYDYYKQTGQGGGGEYRYVRTPTSQGNLQAYVLNEHGDPTSPAKRSYQIRGEANETLTPRWRAGARVFYFTDLVTQQTYNTNIYDASRSQRTFNANLAGSWSLYSLRASYDRADIFSTPTDSVSTGAAPRLTLSRAERPIGNLPIYVRVGGEVVNLQRGNTTAGSVSNNSLSRVDFFPQVRVPFTRLSFLSINSSVGWRGTYWTKSWDANQNILDQSVSRRFFDFQSNISGPVFTRIFDTPNSGYAEKLKHTIEPFVNFRYTTAVPDFSRIVQWESVDSIVGGVTQATYGVNNRLYAKRKQAGGVAAPRQIVEVGLTQTYYTDARASQYDQQYGTAFSGIKPYNFSPIALTVRALPTDQMNATMRAEIDARYKILRTLSTNGSYALGSWLRTSAGWSLTRFINEDGLSDPTRLNNFLNGSANARLANNHYGGNYSLNYDLHNARFVQQRFTAYYNAQCCGFAFEYQTFNFGTATGLTVPHDNRFNFSFTLAGIGSFSNFFGALGGAR